MISNQLPVSILKVVVLPAPFTPSRPKHSPFFTLNVNRSTAGFEFFVYLKWNLKLQFFDIKGKCFRSLFNEILDAQDVLGVFLVADQLLFPRHVFVYRVVLQFGHVEVGSHALGSPCPEPVLDQQGEDEEDDALDAHADHVLAQEVPMEPVPNRDQACHHNHYYVSHQEVLRYATKKRTLTKSGDDEIEIHFGGHVHESAAEAVVGEDEEDLSENGADVLELLVLKVLQDERGHGGDDPGEQVGAGEGHKGGGRNGEQETGRVHQRDGGETEKKKRGKKLQKHFKKWK